MYTRNLTKGAKSYAGKSRANPSKLFRQSQVNRLRAMVSNRNRPTLAQIRYRPINRQEVKCMDTTFQAAYNSAWVVDFFPQRVLNNNMAGAFQSLNLVQQGPGLCQRIGNKISLKSVRLRFALAATGSEPSNTEAQDCRLMLIYDRQPNGGYPSLNDVLNSLQQNNALSNPTGNNLITTNLNPNQFERFSVLMDKMITLPTPTINNPALTTYGLVGPTGNGQDLPWFIDEYIKLKGLECSFKGTTNPEVIGDVTTGNLFLLSIGEFSSVTTYWSFRGTARLRFHDN